MQSAVGRNMSQIHWPVLKVLQSYHKVRFSNLPNKPNLCLQWVYLLRKLTCTRDIMVVLQMLTVPLGLGNLEDRTPLWT